LCSNPAVISP
jgi:hypothetical protein